MLLTMLYSCLINHDHNNHSKYLEEMRIENTKHFLDFHKEQTTTSTEKDL